MSASGRRAVTVVFVGAEPAGASGPSISRAGLCPVRIHVHPDGDARGDLHGPSRAAGMTAMPSARR